METLYNGIRLPDNWPETSPPPSGLEADIPYLRHPPEAIDVTLGRQLFVDSFLIDRTDLQPTYHKAKKHPQNPILKPETYWEVSETLPVACPKSGGVWWDEKARCYRMWYEAGWLNRLAYAESADGIHWERPALNPGTGDNLLFTDQPTIQILKPDGFFEECATEALRMDSTSVWIDPDGAPSQRYKLFLRPPTPPENGTPYAPAIVGTSPDGIHWENLRFTPQIGDRSTVFYNPFRKKWVYSIRAYWKSRSRLYRECDDLLEGAVWKPEEAVHWLAADSMDHRNPYTQCPISLYNTDIIAYESILLGMFEAWYGPDNRECLKTGHPKHTGLIPMYSRDGYHFSRPNREPLICGDECAWDKGYIQSVTGGLIVHKDELWLYYIGFSGDSNTITDSELTNGMYANGATGIAILRRDGFVSMDSDAGGFLLTKALTVRSGEFLFVNFAGSMTVEIITEGGKRHFSRPICCDSTCHRVLFDDFSISKLCGTHFRICFHLQHGQLYAFWLSRSPEGESNGYPGAGMPSQE